MGYVGNTPAEKYASFAVQNFSVSATANYTLDHPVANENDIRLVINNVVQHPGSGKAYTASGTTLTLSEATAGTDTMYCVFLGKAVQTVTPSNSSVTNAMLVADSVNGSKIADDSISDEHLDNTAITGQTAITSLADTDKFLVSDASDSGNLKYVEKQYLPSGTFVKVGDVRSNSAAGSHDLTGIFSDTYDKYFFSLSTFPITAGQYIYMQFLDGSNNPLTSGYYGVAWGREQGPDNATQNYTFSGSTSAIKLNDSTSNGRAWQGQGYIVGPTSGIASNKAVTWQQASYNSDNDMISMVGGFTNVLTTDATGMRIYSGVNLTAISLQVYGVVDTKNYNG